MSKRHELSVILANGLDHFDTALYGFLAPVLAPLFFPKHDYIVQLILTYSILAASAITRPLGSALFGAWGMRSHPLQALRCTLLGVALTTFAIGCLPTFEQGGWIAPLGLLVLRVMMGICGAGEVTIAGLYILENKPEQSAVTVNTWYQASTMWGIIGASFISLWINPNNWRWPFWMGGVLALAALYLRLPKGACVKPPSCANETRPTPLQFVSVIVSGGLGYMNYEIPFVLMNAFIPLVTRVSFQQMMALNTALLVVDVLLMPVIGRVVRHFAPYRVKLTCACVLGMTGVPLFWWIQDASLLYITFVRLWIVCWGVAFCCVRNVWLHQLFPAPSKYFIIGIGSALGSCLMGRMTSTICLFLYYKTGMVYVPGVYLSGVALVLFVLMRKTQKL